MIEIEIVNAGVCGRIRWFRKATGEIDVENASPVDVLRSCWDFSSKCAHYRTESGSVLTIRCVPAIATKRWGTGLAFLVTNAFSMQWNGTGMGAHALSAYE